MKMTVEEMQEEYAENLYHINSLNQRIKALKDSDALARDLRNSRIERAKLEKLLDELNKKVEVLE